ncbi:hypothetical protein RHMOL_Rhmol08G0152700 [Rhododendron molle]|uniref:Uncharacterized protein n=1 Tax=Rhododendron molle TaxID=49168 RepID=A0ACC0MNN9_RHOML|nr:hypothetical protein RHMOL_Rhmol08G0152700 [Rhododendron molle]
MRAEEKSLINRRTEEGQWRSNQWSNNQWRPLGVDVEWLQVAAMAIKAASRRLLVEASIARRRQSLGR